MEWKELQHLEGWVHCYKCSINMTIPEAKKGCNSCKTKYLSDEPIEDPPKLPGTLVKILIKHGHKMKDSPCEIVPLLFLSGFLPSIHKKKLQTLQIKSIINVTADFPIPFPEHFNYLKIPIQDTESVNIYQYFEKTSDLIDRSIQMKEPILVHCMAGISRSSTIVVAYLMKHKKLDLKSAFLLVRKNRPIIAPNKGFFRQLLIYEKQLFGVNSITSEEYSEKYYPPYYTSKL